MEVRPLRRSNEHSLEPRSGSYIHNGDPACWILGGIMRPKLYKDAIRAKASRKRQTQKGARPHSVEPFPGKPTDADLKGEPEACGGFVPTFDGES